MVRERPSFTPFPYTTLFRSLRYSINVTLDGCCDHRAFLPDEDIRSEEHTSELQSLRHLVCRLLLEKKIGLFLRKHEARVHPAARDQLRQRGLRAAQHVVVLL